MKDFWEKVHGENNKRYLTGSTGRTVLSDLGVSLLPTSSVLNIGVGTGECTQAFLRITTDVDVLDISNLALAKAKGARKKFLESELEKLPKSEYDFVLSHLVTQHLTDEALSRQLQFVIPSLKLSGIFAMQFAFSKGEKAPQSIEERCRGGFMMRTLEEMRILISSFGEIIYSKEIPIQTSWKMGWFGIHIRRIGDIG